MDSTDKLKNENTSLDDFEKMLKEQAKEPKKNNSALADFENQLKAGVPAPNNATGQAPPGTIRVKKNLFLSFVSDGTGCGHIRNIFPLTYLNSLFSKPDVLHTVISPVFVTQPEMLQRAKIIFFQRQMAPEHLKLIKQYKQHQEQLKYIMAWDMDDMIWGLNEEQGGDKYHGVPTYNFGAKNITSQIKQSSVEIMNLMDVCTFSTQFLADYAKNVLKVKAKCMVIPNAIPKYLWGDEMRPLPTKEELEKPTVLYTGSPTHYNNEKKKLGDWKNVWKDWVIKSVNNNEINFICMGGLPWFFEPIKDKIKVLGWVGSYDYHNLVKKQNAHIAIMPLVRNDFNHAKSDLKYIEHSADCVPAIGTTFQKGVSPYDDNILKLDEHCDIGEIDEMFKKLKEPEYYDEVRQAQRKQMKDNGRWLETQTYIDHWKELFNARTFNPK